MAPAQPTMLNSPHDLKRAEAAYRTVFAAAGGSEPFRPALASRLLLYPIDYVWLHRAEFEAIAAASLQAGIARAYLAGLGEEAAGWGGLYGHRIVDLRDFDDYRAAADGPMVEHVLYAETAAWGVVTSDARYAIVAGDAEFAGEVARRLGLAQERTVLELVADWREISDAGGSTTWLPPLLGHVLGAGAAEVLWEKGMG